MTKTAAFWIGKLGLVKHPEGGYFVRTYQSGELIDGSHLPIRYGGHRTFSTAIYYLLPGNQVSRFHRIRSDEIWHFYTGSPLILYIISKQGEVLEVKLGRNPDRGESFQAIVEAGQWFGASVADRQSYSLVGCTVAPGFEYQDFELGERDGLIRDYPQHRGLIERLTVKPH